VGLDGDVLVSLPAFPADASDVDLSPDGGTVAFTKNDAGVRQIFTMAIDGSGLLRLTNDRRGAFGPTWSPDGGTIAYSGSGPQGTRDIYLVSVTGGDPERVTHDATVDELQPSWSPDGSRIAFGNAESGIEGAGPRVRTRPQSRPPGHDA
jgi:Tol biopolymer transport system component